MAFIALQSTAAVCAVHAPVPAVRLHIGYLHAVSDYLACGSYLWISSAGVRVAIDECYEVSDSGLISIPWDFSTQDLQPQLLKLLGPKSAQLRAPPGSHGAEAVLRSGLTVQKGSSLTLGHVASQNLLTHFLGNHSRLFGRDTAQSHMQNRQCTGCHQGQHTACYQRRLTACYQRHHSACNRSHMRRV